MGKLRSPACAGQSIVEVMVGLVLMAILGLGYMEMNKQSMMGQNNVRLAMEANNLQNMISLAMQFNQNCTQNFKNLSFSASLPPPPAQGAPIALQQLNTYSSANPPAVTSQLTYIGAKPVAGLTVTKLQLIPITTLNPGTNYLANIHIEMTKTTGTFLGSPIVSADIPVGLRTTAAGGTATISSCGVGNSGVQAYVEFDGTSGQIRTAYNVSSVTMVELGLYTINFTNAMSDTNYGVIVTTGPMVNNAGNLIPEAPVAPVVSGSQNPQDGVPTTTNVTVATYSRADGTMGKASNYVTVMIVE